jgi:hypothetical protein
MANKGVYQDRIGVDKTNIREQVRTAAIYGKKTLCTLPTHDPHPSLASAPWGNVTVDRKTPVW